MDVYTNVSVIAILQEGHVSLVLCFRQRDAGKIRVPIEQPGDVDDVAAGTTDNGGIRVEARHHIPRLRESIVDKDVGVSVVGQINGISSVAADDDVVTGKVRSEEPTSELQSLMRISYAVFCLKKQNNKQTQHT